MADPILTADFQLSSPDFGPGRPFGTKFLFSGLGCMGDNVSPALEWRDPPAETKSFALMVHDAHAVTGGAGIWHWVVVDIPASARALPQGAGAIHGPGLPLGSRQIASDYIGLIGAPGWGGPCPPPGHPPHDYVFTLYALGVEALDLPANATASHYGFMINGMALAKAVLVGVYGR